jgi:hypothetical protein
MSIGLNIRVRGRIPIVLGIGYIPVEAYYNISIDSNINVCKK